MWRHGWILLCIAALLGAGCSNSASEDHQTSNAAAEESTPAETSARETIAIDETVLLQIFVEGLSVFDYSQGSGLTGQVLFPSLGHDLVVSQGKISGGDLSWEKYQGLTLAGKTLEILPDGRPHLKHQKLSKPVGGLPQRSDHAASHFWMMPSETMAGNRAKLKENPDGSWLTMDRFQLETCALVMSQNYDTSCTVVPDKIRTRMRFPIATSEVMVLREELSLKDVGVSCGHETCVDVLKVDGRVLQARVLDLGECSSGNCVKWGREGETAKSYRYLVDVSLRNIHKSPGPIVPVRRMRSIHGSILASVFHKPKHTNWDFVVPGCSDTEPNCWCGGEQPTCWEHLRKYYPNAEQQLELAAASAEKEVEFQQVMSPSNLSICPLVDYP